MKIVEFIAKNLFCAFEIIGTIGNDIHLYETHNCIVHTTQEKKVVVQGLDGYIVAENDNTLLICKLSEEQRIKQFSE